jgi:hypothetical protein
MWAGSTPRRRVTPEAGYNLEEAHHTGWKPELAILVGACGLQRQDTTIWPAEVRIPQCWPAETGYHKVACRGENTTT